MSDSLNEKWITSTQQNHIYTGPLIQENEVSGGNHAEESMMMQEALPKRELGGHTGNLVYFPVSFHQSLVLANTFPSSTVHGPKAYWLIFKQTL